MAAKNADMELDISTGPVVRPHMSTVDSQTCNRLGAVGEATGRVVTGNRVEVTMLSAIGQGSVHVLDEATLLQHLALYAALALELRQQANPPTLTVIQAPIGDVVKVRAVAP